MYRRKLYAELIERCDLPTFLDYHIIVCKHIIHAFEYFGGVPQEILYLIQDTRFYRELREDIEQNRRKYGFAAGKGKDRARQTISPVKPMYELDVTVRPLAEYEQYCGTVQSAGGWYE